MLNAAKNARVFGYLIFASGLLNLVSYFSMMNRFSLLVSIITLISCMMTLVVGFGLISKKVWSIYGLGALTLYEILIVFYNNSVGKSPNIGKAIELGILIVLFFWFYGGKKDFVK